MIKKKKKKKNTPKKTQIKNLPNKKKKKKTITAKKTQLTVLPIKIQISNFKFQISLPGNPNYNSAYQSSNCDCTALSPQNFLMSPNSNSGSSSAAKWPPCTDIRRNKHK